MKLSTVLLSSAALLVAGAAYAADLPAKKAAPAAAPTGCAAFGAGFIAIPGGDTCLKISGYVRANITGTTTAVTRGTAPYALGHDFYIALDSRNNTEIGAVRGFASMDAGVADDEVYVQAGGFTAGYADSLTDFGPGGINNPYEANYHGTVNYAVAFGATTLTIGVETAATNEGNTSVAAGRPDLVAQLKTSAGPAALTVAAVSHEADGATSGSANGYALLGKATLTAGVGSFDLYGAYASGAANYLTHSSTADVINDADDTSSSLSSGTNLGAKISVAAGAGTAYAFGDQINISDAASDSYKATNYGLGYAYTVAKGLKVTPEVYSSTLNTGTGNTTTNTVYLRIQRDF